jgi:1,4-alpha-glucan branching enzyme
MSAAENGIVKIENGKRIVDNYVWQHDDQPLPADHELVIYELHVGDFSGGEDDSHARGKFKHVLEKLDYLCDLGINAIELMPMGEFPGDYSWGYNPRHLFSPETSYGPTEELKQLIDECHAHGIRVIMDGIYNHCESIAPLTKIDYDYWFHHSPRDLEFNWGPEYNYEHYDENLEIYPARRFIGDAVNYWVKEYHIDGIRYDAARQIDNHDFMGWIVEEAKTAAGNKPFYNIAEYIPETPSITNMDGPMDGCWHEGFYHCVLEHLLGDTFDLERLKDVLDAKRRGFMATTNVVNYLSSHDHDHTMVRLADRDIFGEAAFKRCRLGVALLMTAMGVPMLWMGQEFGEYKYKRLHASKIDWTLLKGEQNQDLFEYHKGLIALRKKNQALHTENIDFFHENPESKVLAYGRWSDEGSRVVVIVNFSNQFLADYTIPNFPANGTWHEWTGNYAVEASDHCLTLDLGEYEAKVFVW